MYLTSPSYLTCVAACPRTAAGSLGYHPAALFAWLKGLYFESSCQHASKHQSYHVGGRMVKNATGVTKIWESLIFKIYPFLVLVLSFDITPRSKTREGM